MMADGYISHVTESFPFADDANLFYRFNYEMAVTKKYNKKRLSIGLAMASFWLASQGNPYKEGWMDISTKISGKVSKLRAWLILDNEGIIMYNDNKKGKQILKVLLSEIVRINRTPLQNTFTVTTMLQTKVIFTSKDHNDLGAWQLALDAMKYPNHFSGSCMDAAEKQSLLRSLYFEGYKGGLVKSNDDEEWSYSSTGILQNVDNKEKSYQWDGQSLIPLDDKDTSELGRWDGVRIAWMDGTATEPDVSLTYVHHEGEFINQDPLLNFKWSRHFLVSVEEGSHFWAMNGNVPSPIVMFLQLLRQRKILLENFNAILKSCQ